MPYKLSKFQRRLRRLGFSSYAAFLFSKRWLARKKRYTKRHPRKCYVCGSTERNELHHKTYKRLGRERNRDLLWLCRKHHKQVHKSRKPLEIAHITVRRNYRKRMKHVRKIH